MTKSSGDRLWCWLCNSGDVLNVTGTIKTVKAEIYVVVVLTIQKKNVAFIPVQKQSFYRFLLSLEEYGQGRLTVTLLKGQQP